MSFPNTQSILDSFGRADGAPGTNWTGPALTYPGNNTISGRRMAAGNVAGSSSAWATPMAYASAAYAQVTTLPPLSNGAGVELDLISDLNITHGTMGVILQWDNVSAWELSLNASPGSANRSLAHFNVGDWFAIKFDPAALTLGGWYYDSQLGAGWVQQGATVDASTSFGSGSKNTQGWLAALTFNDGGTCKVGAFGAETVPGSTPTLTAPIVHGRGAC